MLRNLTDVLTLRIAQNPREMVKRGSSGHGSANYTDTGNSSQSLMENRKLVKTQIMN